MISVGAAIMLGSARISASVAGAAGRLDLERTV
jgi:hypothetical protein